MASTRVFVGYASAPAALADAVRSGAHLVGQLPDVDLKTWEDLRIGGNILLDSIEDEVRKSDLSIFDVTQLNENVLFELGLAIGADRAVWPLRDFSDVTKEAEWNTLGLLDTVGQIRFTTSEQIRNEFVRERPDLQGKPLFSTTLAPQISGGRPPALFYFAEALQTDAGRVVHRVLSARATEDLGLVVADPVEASVQTLSWFAQHIFAAEAVVVHLAACRRRGAASHNARASLLAGLARGMKRPLLMLAESDFESALDYRDLLFRYPSADDCGTRVAYWLERELAPVDTRFAKARDAAEALRLSTELRSIDLGEYVAENEARGLANYYVETATYREVMSGASRVYVGSKGTGKSATVLRAQAALRQDKRNLVCSITPAGYDLNGLVRLLTGYEELDEKGYVAESLWKYLLLTELALAVERDLATRPAGAMPETPEWELLSYLAANREWMKADFAVRLEQTVDRLLNSGRGSSLADHRSRVAEALHAGPLRQLRELLVPALGVRQRVFIVVDNLDKAWDKGADIPQLSRLILALLACMDSFRHDLEREGAGIPVSLSLFLRNDIFASVAALAREPDKLPVKRMTWEAELPLLEIVNRRYQASRESIAGPDELWEQYFCEQVGGLAPKDWMLQVCLPRPRDLLYLCRAAIDQALGNHHARVEVQDLGAAERQYSLFAFESAAVEAQQRIPNVEDVLLEFAGVSTHLAVSQLRDLFRAAGLSDEEHDRTRDALLDVGFLGFLTPEGSAFPDSPREQRRAAILARRLAAREHGDVTYVVHPAFWSYLELERGDKVLSLGL